MSTGKRRNDEDYPFNGKAKTEGKPPPEAENIRSGIKTEIGAEEVKDRILKLAEWFPPSEFNFASPSRSISGIPRGHKIAVGVVTLKKAPSDDYHESSEGQGENKAVKGYFVSAQGMRKLAALAGVDALSSETVEKERDKDGRLMMIKHKVIGAVTNFDGSLMTAQATKTIDRGALLDLGYKDYRVKKIMAFAGERAETGAFARVARHLLGIENLIRLEMTGKPWIVLKLTLDVDPTDADHKRFLLERQYGGHGAKQLIYGDRQEERPALPDPNDITNLDEAEQEGEVNDETPY